MARDILFAWNWAGVPLAGAQVINGNHTTFGIVGSVWTHPMLEAAGRGDVALSTLTTDAYPGFGHMVANNMRTLCENWECGFHDPGGERGPLNKPMSGGSTPIVCAPAAS